jgi:hypothetical protein
LIGSYFEMEILWEGKLLLRLIREKKWSAVLTIVVMFAALLAPFAGTASAATTYSLSYVPSVSAGAVVTPTNLFLTVTMDNPCAEDLAGSQVVLGLPSTPSGYLMTLGAPEAPSGVFTGNSNLLSSSIVTETPVVAGQASSVSYTVYVSPSFTADTTGVGNNTTTSSFSIPITSLTIPGGVNGNVTLTAAAPNGSMFASGSLTIATAGTGNVTLAAESVQSVSSGSNQHIGYIDTTESMAGALSNSGGTALKLTLPAGVTWDTASFSTVWGTFAAAGPWQLSYTGNGGRELDISTASGVSSTVYDSQTAMFVKLIGTVDIDQSVAQYGDVVVTVGGASNYTPSTLTVANYPNPAINNALSARMLNTPTITAGMAGSTIGEFEVWESQPGSLIAGRTIDLTLPSNVVWSEVPQEDTSNSTMDNYNISSIYAVGSSGNEIEITIGGAQSTSGVNLAVIVFKNAEVTPAVDFSGPVIATLGGTEGLVGTLELANVAAGVSGGGGPSGGGGGGGSSSAVVYTPTVQTEAATSVTATSAVLNGDITSDKGYDITAYGFLWGTSSSSLTNKLDVGTDNHSGAFTDTLSGLTAGMTYYFQAYTKNGKGTGDGAVMSFTAGASPTSPTTPSTPSSTAPVFSDVSTSYWGYNAIMSLSSKGIVSGYPDGTFKPDASITRAEFATMLVKALGLSATGTAGKFTDVTAGAWYYGTVNAAASAGLVSGPGDNLFAPTAPVYREQMAVMVAKALGNKAPATNGTELNAFSDKSAVSSWAVSGMDEAVKAGIVSGMTADTLAPMANATRAQAAAMVYKLLGVLGK